MIRTNRSRLGVALGAAVAVAFLLSSCSTSTGSSSTTTDTAAVVGGASQVKVSLAEGTGGDVCTLDSSTAKAGPVTFTIKDVSSTAISEVELLSDERILGEKENLAPGLAAVSFTVTLTGGTYQVYCPGAKKELQNFTVTGKHVATSDNVSVALKSGISGYA